jgi:hypothetical protein
MRKLGIESILFESPTLSDARAALAHAPVPGGMMAGPPGRGAAPAA